MRRFLPAVFHAPSRRFVSLLTAVFASVASVGSAAAQVTAATPRERVSLNSGWRFEKLPTGMADGLARAQPGYDDARWRKLDLPHDWGIEGPFRPELPNSTAKLPWAGIGWYRLQVMAPESDRGRHVFLDLDGAMSHAQIWLNGQQIGEWAFGYTSFHVDLTPHWRPGAPNVIAIRLDNPPESSRWYPGGGLYRNVWLVRTGPVRVAHNGVFVTTPEISPERAKVDLRVWLENRSGRAARIVVRHEIVPRTEPSRILARTEMPVRLIPPGRELDLQTQLEIERPALWDLASPQLHLARTSVVVDGTVVDTVETSFGIRRVEIHPANGITLNGRPLRLNGVCHHSDIGPLGTVVNIRAIERQLEILRELGANAIRGAHNPLAPEFLDLCDRMGFLVIAEAFDAWRFPARDWVPNDYARDFATWSEWDVRALVRRDRNHPSIIMWSSGNEIQDQRKPDGVEVAKRLRSLFHEEDPTRPVTGGLDDPNVVKNGFHRGFDVIGYNYKPHLYAETRRLAPEWPVFGSETASTVTSRGEYFFPVEQKLGDGADVFQVSSYDLYHPPWASTPDVEFAHQDDTPSVLGEFVWTGFDYLGEPTPYDPTRYLSYTPDPEDRRRMVAATEKNGGFAPSRSSYFGIVDLCGFPKDRFYLYQARWRPDHPMAHLLPHWTWPERVGHVTPVHVYTSGDEAELFLNGRSLGRKQRGPRDYRLRWDDVVYQPGELRVVAYKGGREWATDVQRTSGAATAVALTADRAALRADGEDLAFITASIRDAEGRLAPRASDRVRFRIEGPADLVAVDNGDATRLESFQADNCAAFNGLCLAIIRPKAGQPGTIIVHAEAGGLAPARVVLRSAR